MGLLFSKGIHMLDNYQKFATDSEKKLTISVNVTYTHVTVGVAC